MAGGAMRVRAMPPANAPAARLLARMRPAAPFADDALRFGEQPRDLGGAVPVLDRLPRDERGDYPLDLLQPFLNGYDHNLLVNLRVLIPLIQLCDLCSVLPNSQKVWQDVSCIFLVSLMVTQVLRLQVEKIGGDFGGVEM
jgi:hypothetical protein